MPNGRTGIGNRRQSCEVPKQDIGAVRIVYLGYKSMSGGEVM